MSRQRHDAAVVCVDVVKPSVGDEEEAVLHFPSTSTSARVARHSDVDRLNELLGDDVWAFSNCRVDAAHQPVAELDWLFYNTTLGTLMLSEWKRYPSNVAEAKDRGDGWRLQDGTLHPNPLEQADKQQKALRSVLQEKIHPKFFPDQDAHRIKVMESVYCPQIDHDTVKDRLQFGKLYGSIEDLCAAVNTLKSPSPLLVSDMASVLELAAALAELFRCAMPDGLEEAVVWEHNPKESARFWQEARRIHSSIAALHQEMAQLIDDEFAPRRSVPAEKADEPSPVKTVITKNHKNVSDAIEKHVSAHVAGFDGNSEDFVEKLGRALHAILADLPPGSWVGLAAFGSAVGAHFDGPVKLRDHLGAPLWEWSLETAKKYGLSAEVDEAHLKVRIVDDHRLS
ncbi:NERD domain-containing protein [Arthrobacter sp. UYCo732]|uniref:NERD domain-containing protein n=1 Tax=Arthrobacter sp. UYCo732 TaxID=3156336 RepID=UPI003393A4C2